MCEHTFIDVIEYNSMLAYFGRTFHLAFLECLSTFHLCLYHFTVSMFPKFCPEVASSSTIIQSTKFVQKYRITQE